MRFFLGLMAWKAFRKIAESIPNSPSTAPRTGFVQLMIIFGIAALVLFIFGIFIPAMMAQ
jgi:hypothetical protein